MRSANEAPDDPLRPSPGMRWLLFFLDLVVIGLAAWVGFQLPLPVLDDWLPIKNVVVAMLAVGTAGKCLYDTLFYDRFWP